MRFASESYAHTNLVTLGFYWTFGSRHETAATSGICNFIQRLQFKGTADRTREDIANELQALGGNYTTTLERERVGVSVTVHKDQVGHAVCLFGDMIQNSQYNAQQVEAEREVVLRSQTELARDQLETTLENMYFTSYRDHQMGQPTRGVRENTNNVSQTDINEWVGNFCVGKNLVVVASGDVNHEVVCNSVNETFGEMPQSSGVELANQDKPIYTPSLISIRDDEMANVNVAVFFNAPSYTNEDFWAFHMLNNLMGEYNEFKHTGVNLNAADRQYSQMHTLLGNLPDISIQKSFYMPGGDHGLFGSYLHGNEVHAPQMMMVSQAVSTEYAYHIGQAEIFRARAQAFNWLLNSNGASSRTNSQICNEVVHFGRRVPRSEQALRISNVADQTHMQRVCAEWLWDREVVAAIWGPMHSVNNMMHYNRTWKRSTLGWYGTAMFNSQ